MAEPLACWQPLDPKQPHYNYYLNNPEWHMYNKPDHPSHQMLIDARDQVVERHPGLRIVGAHFGSLEYDVAEMAERFDRYPNFAVDSSARLMDLTLQSPEVVRQFFIDYQDRLLFGTDVVQWKPVSQLSAEERTAHLAQMTERFQADFAYYETDQKLTMRGREIQGLGLPDEVLAKFYEQNARNWYPGL
jgi:predicted TIM-barrel fold metal-dependent hydrolase